MTPSSEFFHQSFFYLGATPNMIPYSRLLCTVHTIKDRLLRFEADFVKQLYLLPCSMDIVIFQMNAYSFLYFPHISAIINILTFLKISILIDFVHFHLFGQGFLP